MTVRAIRIGEWERLTPESPGGAVLRGLCLGDERARRLASELARQRLLVVEELRTGLSVQSTSWVGRVRLGEIDVVVEPKLAPDLLLSLFRHAYALRDLRLLDRAEQDEGRTQILDLLLVQLRAEVKELIDRGLCRRYRAEATWLASPRGRIDFAELSSAQPLTEARLPCRFATRSADHALTRALRAGLALGATMTTSSALALALARLAGAMAGVVEQVPLTNALLAEAWRSLDRLSRAYEPALRIVTLLGAGGALSIEGRGGLELPGFLFDMNRFFQALLGRFLGEHLEGWTLREERTLGDLMRYLPDRNPLHRRPPRPRPDFTLTRPGEPPILLDAKYRDLWAEPLERNMLYQLAVYALSQGPGGTATILYPTVSPAAREAVIRIDDPVGREARGFVALRPVPLHELHAVLTDPSRAGRARARNLAARLGLGRSSCPVA